MSIQFSNHCQASIMCCVVRAKSHHKMKFTVIFVFIFFKYGGSTDFNCGYDKMESVEVYCSNFEGIVPEYCSSLFSVTNVTNESKVISLKVGGCDSDVIKQFVEKYPNLRSLDISQSGIDSLYSFNLKHDHLAKVNISHNRLTTLPRQFFSQLPAITEIDCSHNGIELVRDLPQQLDTVHLSHNNLSYIYYSSFKNLNNLKYLDLSFNLIDGVNFISIFPSTLKLKILRLDNNPIIVIHDDVKSLVKLGISVYISWKNIRQFSMEHMPKFNVILNSTEEGFIFSEESTSNDSVQLHCNEKSFENVENFKLGTDQFENAAELMNFLTSSLKILDLSTNDIEKLELNFFERFVNLENLNLKATHLSEFDFSWLKNQKKLQKLDISANNMEKVVNASFLKSLENLHQLNAQENQLKNTPEIIQYLKSSITNLMLTDNYVGEINTTTFEKLVNLEKLHLGNTSLSFQQSNPFQSLKKLRFLDISYNNLGYVDFTALPNEHLYGLYLTGNELTELDGVNRVNFPKLKLLIIEQNRIPCNYLMILVQRLEADTSVRFGNLWNQKHGENCRPEEQRIHEEAEEDNI